MFLVSVALAPFAKLLLNGILGPHCNFLSHCACPSLCAPSPAAHYVPSVCMIKCQHPWTNADSSVKLPYGTHCRQHDRRISDPVAFQKSSCTAFRCLHGSDTQLLVDSRSDASTLSSTAQDLQPDFTMTTTTQALAPSPLDTRPLCRHLASKVNTHTYFVEAQHHHP